MSCCAGSNRCKFEFPAGNPIVDNSVDSLHAKYLFLPYGTLLLEGELVRIWTENGQTKSVLIEKKIPITVTPTGLKVANEESFIPWELVALDSAIELDNLENWYFHPLHNPSEPTVLLKFKHPYDNKKSIKNIFLSILYKIRNL
jgi:hypothetical protein